MDQLAVFHSVPTDQPALENWVAQSGFERQIERWLGVRKEHAVRELPQLFELGDWLARNVPAAMTPGSYTATIIWTTRWHRGGLRY